MRKRSGQAPLELPLLDLRRAARDDRRGSDREAWQWDQVPDHLKNFLRVVDDKNKKLQEGARCRLKRRLKGQVQETLSAVADDGIEQSRLHIWSFGTWRKVTKEAR